MEIQKFLLTLTGVFLAGQTVGVYTEQYCTFDDVTSRATKMVCSNLTAESDLEEEIKFINRFEIPQLAVENSTLRFFLHSSFRRTTFQTIFIRRCSILAMTDTDVAFEGLENHLRLLIVENSSLVNHWDWYHLRNLQKLKTLYVLDSDLIYVTQSFGHVATLEHLELGGNSISWIEEKALARLTQLKILHVDNNRLPDLKRNMFPTPASIQIFDFSYNLLQNLPVDIFNDMPNLNSVYLAGNRLRTIDEKLFGPIWGKLEYFFFKDNPLSCDCRLKWVTRIQNHPVTVYAQCDTPAELKGKYLITLKSKDLWC